MKKTDAKKLRKQYPKDKYDIVASQGSLIVSPLKAIIWTYTSDILLLGNHRSEDASTVINKLIDKKKLTEQDFKQSQISVFRETALRLRAEAKKCKVRQIVYLRRLTEK